jgi:hypothetical protein
MLGWTKQVTNSFSGGLYFLALVALAGAVVTFITVKVVKTHSK